MRPDATSRSGTCQIDSKRVITRFDGRRTSKSSRRFVASRAVTWPDDAAGVVELPDGRRIRARGLRRPMPDGPRPQLGVYLLGRRPPASAWEQRWVRWPDFGTPRDTDDALDALRIAYERAEHERVE